MKNSLFTTAVLVLVSGISFNASAASESTNATISIVKSLTLTKTKDLAFPTATQGDAAFTVTPADAASAKFDVSGDNDANITTAIVEPSIIMTKDLGETDQQKIVVDNFQHNAPATLSATGTASFGVGATHAAILADQEAGSYAGVFNVTVSYQ